MSRTSKIVLATAAMIALGPSLAVAQVDEDALSDATLLCSVGRLQACTDGTACQPASHEDYDAPRFLVIDLENRLILSPDPERSGQRSEIRRLENLDDRILLQGSENMRAWSMIISKTDAELTISAADDGLVVAGAGDCIPYPRD